MATALQHDDVAVGIDLGTTYSCVAIFQNDKVKIIPNDNGNRITPSVVSFTEYGYVVGDEAKNRLTLDPENTIYESKRLIGRASDDPMVEHDKAYWPFRVVDVDGKPMIQVNCAGETKEFSAESISGYVLEKMKKTAEDYLGQAIHKAVITVPAYFNDSQRQATKDAARLARLEVLRIINEPTAAALAYGLQKNVDQEQHVLVFDLGGGTFDVSLLRIDDGAIQVKGTGGNTHLGGADFDNKLVDVCINYFNHKEEVQSDVTTDSTKREYHRLRKACELAKCQISSHEEETVFVEMFHERINLSYVVTRSEFDVLINDLLDETMTHMNQTLKDENMGPERIDKVVLIGGSTRIPRLRQKLAQCFGKEKICTSINPDEAVAYGAAIQAAILTGNTSDMLSDVVLIDVTPLSLGINVKGDMMLTIVKRNSLIPCRHSKEVTTVSENQKVIKCSIYQGERPLTKDNHFLGEFCLRDIPPQPPGIPKIDVMCDIDADGCLKVKATDKSTSKSELINIEPSKARCNDRDIQRILEDANKHLTEDLKEKQRITARNKLDELVQWLIYILKSHSENLRISPNQNQTVFAKVKEIEDWLKNNLYNDETDYSERLEELQDTCSCVSSDYSTPGKLPNNDRVKVVGGYGVLCYSDESDIDDVPEVD